MVLGLRMCYFNTVIETPAFGHKLCIVEYVETDSEDVALELGYVIIIIAWHYRLCTLIDCIPNSSEDGVIVETVVVSR